MILQYNKVLDLITNIFIQNGLNQRDSKIVAEAIIDSEMHGKISHGLIRTPDLVDRIKEVKGPIETIRDKGCLCILEGNNNLGQILFWEAKEIALEKCREFGIGIVAARNKFSFLSAQYYPRLLAEENKIGILLANSKIKVVPFGSKMPGFGTNPLAIGIPSNKGAIVLDMAMSKIASKDVDHALKIGKQLPPNSALDSDGNPTCDAQKAKKGFLLPFGGHKGSGLGIMIEILCGPLIGAKCGNSTPGKRGYLLIAIDPEWFGNRKHFLKQVDDYIDEIHNLSLSNPNNPVLLPGDRARRFKNRIARKGISISDDLYKKLINLAN